MVPDRAPNASPRLPDADRDFHSVKCLHSELGQSGRAGGNYRVCKGSTIERKGPDEILSNNLDAAGRKFVSAPPNTSCFIFSGGNRRVGTLCPLAAVIFTLSDFLLCARGQIERATRQDTRVTRICRPSGSSQ